MRRLTRAVSRTGPLTGSYTEKDWNTDAPAAVEKEGKNSSGGDAYQTSKTLAEQSLWSEWILPEPSELSSHTDCAEFIEEEKPKWDAATINPPLVLGEVIHQCEKPESLNTSVGRCLFLEVSALL